MSVSKGRLLKLGGAGIAIKLSQVLFGVSVAIVLARILGVDGYGSYSFVFSIITILSIPVQLGMSILVVREVASAKDSNALGRLRGIWLWANALTFGSSIIFGAIASLFVGLGYLGLDGEQTTAFYWGVGLLAVMSLIKIYGAALRGVGEIIKGQLPELAFRPLFFALVLLLLIGINLKDVITPSVAMMMHFCAGVFVLFVARVWLKSSLPHELNESVPEYHSKKWLSSVVPLTATIGMQYINEHADLIMLGYMSSPKDVGLYRVAGQGAMLISFGVHAINMVVAPRISQLFTKNSYRMLQGLVAQSCLFSFLSALPVFVMFMFFGDWLIAVAFGYDYSQSYVPMIIMSFGYLLYAGIGPSALLLNMTGNEKSTAVCVGIGAMVNIIMNVFMIPLYGVNGAAISTVATLLITSYLLRGFALKKLSIDTSLLSFLQREKWG